MAQEVERKFLLSNDGWRRSARKPVAMRQGYLGLDGPGSTRVRIEGERAFLNLKSATLGVSRLEFEYPVPLADAQQILERLCVQPIIEKTRYHVTHARHRWEIDVFAGENTGLIVAEIELSHPDEPFARPDWLGPEVSGDPRYYNVSLVQHPYKDWGRP
ncbi:MAG: CYTH domain-containing protein [Gammaproteobacteria bacterium]